MAGLAGAEVRAASAWTAGGLALGAGLSRLPLLDGLSYELGVVVTVAAFGAACALGSRAARVWQGGTSTAAVSKRRETARARLEPGLGRALFRLTLATLAAAVPAVAGGIRDGCAWERGVPVYLFLCLPALALGLALGVLAGALRLGARRPRRRAAGVYAAFVLATLALTGAEALLGPRAVFHNLVLGLVSGTAYLGLDESVRLASHDALHRVASLVLALALLALGCAVAERRGMGTRDGRRRERRRLVVLGTLLAAMVAAGEPFGFGTGRRRLEGALAARAETPHLVLRFRPGSRVEASLDLVTADCEWAHGRMSRLLGLEGSTARHAASRTTIYLYDGGRERLELTGAWGYLFAKPWLGEIHTELDAEGEPAAVAHELVHVLAARFGLPLIKVSARYGLIEGVAEGVAGGYAERPWRHEPVAAALRLGLLPPARELVANLGFASSASAVAYPAAASFCGFLLRAHGAAALRQVYAWGSFDGAYGLSLEELDGEWRRFLAGLQVSERALAQVSRSWDRAVNPPFFRRRCARLGLSPRGARASARAPAPSVEAARARHISSLDREAATGPLLGRDRALAGLAETLARENRVEEALAVLRRRLDLGVLAASSRAVIEAVLREPDALLALALGVEEDLAGPPCEGPASGALAVLRVARALARGASPERLAPEALALGGCAPGLAGVEAMVLRDFAERALRARRDDLARRAARGVLSLAGAGDEERFDAGLLLERLGSARPAGVNAF